MADTTASTNMNLPIPIVGQDPGPTYATDVNNCLTLVDQHNHSAGYGVPVNPAGLNINADLTFNGNNLTTARSLRLQPQNAPLALVSDLGCLYESGVDLYYNDGNGNQVRITQSGGVAGSPGSIANLTSPASASYVAIDLTFVWQSDANTPAKMDAGSFIFRNMTAGSKGLTLAPPAAMGSDYTVTLPSLPASQKIMTLDASGNMSAPYTVDNSTIVISANQIQAGPKTVVANSTPSASLAIVRGIVSSTGVATGGEGFSCSRAAPGTYIVSYDTPFADNPSSSITPEFSGVTICPILTARSASGFTVTLNNSISFTPTDEQFCFITIGKKA